MKPDNDHDKRILSRWIIIWLVLLILALLYFVLDTRAAQDSKYITQRRGFHGLIIECHDDLPYQRLEPLCYENGAWCVDIDPTQTRHYLTVVEVASCDALTNVYRNDGRAFALEGMQIGSDGQPHPTRGAYWITLD